MCRDLALAGGHRGLVVVWQCSIALLVGYWSFVVFPWNACAIKSETAYGISKTNKRKYDRNDARKLDDDTYLIVQTMLVETAEVFFLALHAGLLALGQRSFPRKQLDRVVRVQELFDISPFPVCLASNAS